MLRSDETCIENYYQNTITIHGMERNNLNTYPTKYSSQWCRVIKGHRCTKKGVH